MEISKIHELFLKCSSVSTDTRKIEVNSIFFALKGENFDANTFATQALEKGASFVVIDNKDYYVDQRTILVDDSLVALQNLAKYHRQYLKTPILAITGSNGKTTTKELLYSVLSKKFKTKATVGNLNNHIGVPLTLLSFDENTEFGIVEMGANHQKEIEFLCHLALPDFGYITNFGKAHLEGFGGVEGVIKGKSEMYAYLSENDKLAFINYDDPIQVEKTTHFKHFSFGLSHEKTNVSINTIEANPFVKVQFSDILIQTQLIGLYNANNINAAIAVGNYFKIDKIEIKNALESYVPENNRSQIIKKGTNQIILDAYNANPSSMMVAIDNFLQLKETKKTLVLGDMFELGDESFEEHKSIVEKLIKLTDVNCFFVGSKFLQHQVASSNMHFYETFVDFSDFLNTIKIENSSLLIKGSRGMTLERTLDFI